MVKVYPEQTNYDVFTVVDVHHDICFTVVKFNEIDTQTITGYADGDGLVEFASEIDSTVNEIEIHYEDELDFVGIPSTKEAIAVFIK
jgi:activator of 2-hydroxyglutaryl-CoA dehydratase